MGNFFLAYQCCALFARDACGHLALLRLSKRNDFVKLTFPTEAGLPGCRYYGMYSTVESPISTDGWGNIKSTVLYRVDEKFFKKQRCRPTNVQINPMSN